MSDSDLLEPVVEVEALHARRRPVVAGGALVVALLMVAAGLLWSGSDGSAAAGSFRGTPERPRVRDWKECDSTEWLTAAVAEVPDELRYAPAFIPAGYSTRASLLTYRDHEGCHHGAEALILARKDPADPAVVRSVITVRGPSYRPARPEDPRFPSEPVAVRGGDGRFRFGGLEWTDPDGGQWTVTGAERDVLVAVIDGLSIDLAGGGPPVEAGHIPEGYDVLWQRAEPEGRGFDNDWTWNVRLEPDDPSANPVQYQISVTRMSTPGTVFEGVTGDGVRLTTMRGRPAVEASSGRDGEQYATITWDEEAGVTVSVFGTSRSGPPDMGIMRRIGESVELVARDDPRAR
jgi:hypothetical protein